MARRLRTPARQVWRFGEAFASTGATRFVIPEGGERRWLREHRSDALRDPRRGTAKTTRFAIPDGGKPKPKIAGRGRCLRHRECLPVQRMPGVGEQPKLTLIEPA